MELLFQKGTAGMIPACEEAAEWLAKKKLGASILVEAREMRNGAFFRKWWALVSYAFGEWSEFASTIEYRGQSVLPDKERFRKDVTILAGFYRPVVNIKGEVRMEAESLKWSSMSEERFRSLYDATIQVLLQRVFNGRVCKARSEPQLREIIEEVLRFAA